MSGIEYSPAELQRASRAASVGADSAGTAAAALEQLSTEGGSPFGQVAGADLLHGAVRHAHRTHAARTRSAAADLHRGAGRASTTAALGVANDRDTSADAGAGGIRDRHREDARTLLLAAESRGLRYVPAALQVTEGMG